jgi:hypothetical protein
MEHSTIKTLAGSPPPGRRHWRFTTARAACSEINRLERLLGLPQSAMSFNLASANKLADDLAARVPASMAAPAAPVPTAPTANADVIGFAEWRGMGEADARHFARNGGKMWRDEFLLMPSVSQSFFLSNGGRLETAAVPPPAPKTKNPPANSMWREDFHKLEAKAQTAFFAKGGKLHD